MLRLISYVALQAGASPSSRNCNNKSATDLAEDDHRAELLQLFRRVVFGTHRAVYRVALLTAAKNALIAGDVAVLRDVLTEEPGVAADFLPDMEGDMLLHLASSLPFIETTSLLLQLASADVNSVGSNGRSPLHVAAASGNISTVQMLLNYGANVHAVSNDGSTVLAVACAHGYGKIAEALVVAGCSLDAFDSTGLAAIHHASRGCHTDCISVLHASVNTLDARRDPPL
jgi:ankyrin repeat protein